jgi:uncharacterized membrane protein YdfJ with MMPL/SSD domain
MTPIPHPHPTQPSPVGVTPDPDPPDPDPRAGEPRGLRPKRGRDGLTGGLGPVGRLGRYTATHFRGVLIAWLLVAVVLGFFAPRVETALSGAGWETSGSSSVQARKLIDTNFHGLSSYALMTVVYSPTQTVSAPAFRATLTNVERTLRADGAVSTVIAPNAGGSISRDGHTAIVQAGAARDSNAMVAAANRLAGPLSALSTGAVQVHLTGASGMWSDFNAANRSAMLRSEVISWPVTLVILLLAFGSLVAAGLPLMLTMVGLMAAAGSLYLATQVMPISIWAMNFALMFALALGIDYALFVVHRFRGALFGSHLSAGEAVAQTMDTAGKAVLFSGATVLISLSAVMLVPSPAFRSMSLGIMLAVIFVLAATLTLLPAVLGKLGPRVDKLALPWAHSGEHRSARFAAWGERLWRRQDPSNPAVAQTIDRLRATLPAGSLIGGAVAENHDLQNALSAKTPLVIGVVLALGFLLLLIALQAPLLAAVGVLTNLLATAAAFGVAKLVFQDGDLHALLGFQPQGFLDAWGPVFFFAMIFAISMDYTVFLLSSAKEHWDRTHDPKQAMIGGLAHSGRVIFAAGVVMVAVFFTFALSGPLPPKEMGIILGVAVLLDAALIRLLLLPVLLRLMGKRAWYLPRWAHRVLPDVSFGHA